RRKRRWLILQGLQKGNQVGPVRVLGNARKGHLVARHEGLGVLQIGIELFRAPCLPGAKAFHCVGILELRDRCDGPPDHAPEVRPDFVGGGLGDVVAGLTPLGDGLALGRIASAGRRLGGSSLLLGRFGRGLRGGLLLRRRGGRRRRLLLGGGRRRGGL